MASLSSYAHYSTEVPFALLAQNLQKYSSREALQKARQLHALITITTLPSSPPYLHNLLLSLYSQSCSLADARKLFDKMPVRNTVSYNTMISAYSRTPHHANSSVQLFNTMFIHGLKANSSTYASVIHASCTLKNLSIGRSLHARVITSGFRSNVCVQTSILGLYSECGSSDSVNTIFTEMADRDVVAWNSVITSNVKNGNFEYGLLLYSDMIRNELIPSLCTFTVVLNACGQSGDWFIGRTVHAQMIKSELLCDVKSQNSLLVMYASCGDLDMAFAVFTKIETPDLISWNSLISGYSDNGNSEKAIDAFKQVMALSVHADFNPDNYTFAAIVSATESLPSLYYGKPLHAQVIKLGWEDSIHVGNTLLSMYFENEEAEYAQKLFSTVHEKDFKIWTEMIVGYSRLNKGEEALRYFYRMQDEGHKVDNISLSSALNSCADLAALRHGEAIHSLALKSGYEDQVGPSMVDLYAKNGKITDACLIFRSICQPDLKCWNTIIGAHGNHGNAEEAFKIFDEMVKHGLQPDQVTYVTLLSACNHSSLIDKGKFYWFCMLTDGIKPGIKHYTCMVCLLSKIGMLCEAKEMIIRSPFGDRSPDLWRILLSSCVNLKNLEVGIYAANQVLSFGPDDSSTLILLSNLYASVGKWGDVAKVRKKIKGLMLEKEPGLSWIESRGVFHAFSADDQSHNQVDDCRIELLKLKGNLEMKEPEELILPYLESAC